MVERLFSIDDYGEAPDPAGGAIPDDTMSPEVETPPAPAAPPEPAGRTPTGYGFYEDEMSAPYQEYLKQSRGRPRTTGGPKKLFSLDEGGTTPAPGTGAYDPDSDWAITRGFKTGYTGGTEAIGTIGEMARMMTLSEDEARQEMIKFGKRPRDPSNASLEVESLDQVGGIGDAWTFVMESIGQMGGSMAAAAMTGGATGGATGAAIGAAGGTAAAGLGALPGAIAGGVAGAGYGTLAAFGPMGVGGMYRDLLQDEGVQAGLADGTVSPTEILTWAGTAGAAIGALDAAPIGRLGKVVGFKDGVKKTLKEGITKAAKAGALKQAGAEGGTEALQGAISEFGQAVVGGDTDLARRSWSVINQGVVGGIGGGAAGAVAGAYEDWMVPPQPGTANPATPSTATPPATPTVSPQPSGPGGLGAPAAPPTSAGTGGQPPKKVTVVNTGEVAPDVAFAAEAANAGRPAAAIPEDEADIDEDDGVIGAGVAEDVAAALTAAKPAQQAAPTGQPAAPVAAAPEAAAPTPPAPPVIDVPAAPAETVTEAAPVVADEGVPAPDAAQAGLRRSRAAAEFNRAMKAGDAELIEAARQEFLEAMRELRAVDPEQFDHYANLPGNRKFFPELLQEEAPAAAALEAAPARRAARPKPAPLPLEPAPAALPEPGFVPRGPEFIEEEERPGIGDIPANMPGLPGRIFPPVREGAARPVVVAEQRTLVHPLIAEEMDLSVEERQAREAEDARQAARDAAVRREISKVRKEDKRAEQKEAEPDHSWLDEPIDGTTEAVEPPADPHVAAIEAEAEEISGAAVRLAEAAALVEAHPEPQISREPTSYKGRKRRPAAEVQAEIESNRVAGERSTEARGRFAQAVNELREAADNAAARLEQFQTFEDYEAYYYAMHPYMREALGDDYIPENYFDRATAPAAPQPRKKTSLQTLKEKGPYERVKGGWARVKERVVAKRRERAERAPRTSAVDLVAKREKEEAPKPVAAESGKRDVKLSIATWRAWRSRFGLAAAVDKMKAQGAILIDRKTRKRAKLVDVISDVPPKMVAMGERPTFEFQGKFYNSAEQFDIAMNEKVADSRDVSRRKKANQFIEASKKDVAKLGDIMWNNPFSTTPGAKLSAEEQGRKKRHEAAEAEAIAIEAKVKRARGVIRKIDKELEKWQAAKRTPEFQAVRRWEETLLARKNLKGQKLDDNEKLIKVSTLKNPITQPELLRKFEIVIPGVERAEPHAPISTRKTDEQVAVDALREHFAGDKPTPVRLASLDFTEARIKSLEGRGLAENGIMDAAEFRRWQGSERGAVPVAGMAAKQLQPGAKVTTPSKLDYLDEDDRQAAVRDALRRIREDPSSKRKDRGRVLPIETVEPETGPYKRRVPDTSESERLPSEKVRSKLLAFYEMATEREMPSPAERAEYTATVSRGKGKTEVKVEDRLRVGREIPVVAKRRSGIPLTRAIEHKPSELWFDREKRPLAERVRMLRDDIVAMMPTALRWAGVAATLSDNAIIDAANKAAESQLKEAKALPPILAARERFKAGMYRAIEDYKAGRKDAINRYLASQSELDAKALEQWKTEVKQKKYRQGSKSGRKLSSRIASEQHMTTRYAGRRELLKPEGQRNTILEEIGELDEAINHAYANDRADSVASRAAWKVRINELQQERIAEQVALETGEAIDAAEKEAARREEEVLLEKDVAEWIASGMVEQEEAREYWESLQAGEKFKKRAEREPKTRAIIHEAMRKHPRPVGPAVGERTTPRQEAELIKAIGEWAIKWSDAIEAAIAKAGLKINERYSKEHNSPEENVYIYVQELRHQSESKFKFLEKRIRDKRLKEGEKVKYGKQVMTPAEHRGMSLIDAHFAVGLVEPSFTEDMTSAGLRFQRYKAVELLHGIITDASKTKASIGGSVADDVRRETQEAEAALYGETPARKPAETQLGGELQSWMAANDWKSHDAPALEEDLPEGVEQTMSGAEALTKYAKETQGLTGWRKMVRRALVKTLRQMVGNVPVHFVNGEIISAYTSDGKERPGTYNYNDGDPIVMIHSGLLNRPRLLATTIVHEMVHAATAYAINHNLRGTRDIIRGLMNDIKPSMPESYLAKHEFKDEHEFLTAAMEHDELQTMLSLMHPSAKSRALIRALGKGRIMPSYWDLMVAAVQNAIGLFIPGRAGTTYMDEILRLYPHAAMSSAEQMADAATRADGIEGDLTLDAPFSMPALSKSIGKKLARRATDAGVTGRKWLNKAMTPTETIRRRVADLFFGGKLKNIFSDLIDQLTTYQYRVEQMMAEGDQQDNRLREWMMEDSGTRRGILAAVHSLIVNASIDRIDPRKTLKQNTWIWDDADHPLASGKKRKVPSLRHMRDSGRRKAHPRYKAEWDALPDDLKALVSDRLDMMKTMMVAYETDMVSGFLDRLLDATGSLYHLPPGMSRTDAVKEIMDGKMSADLKTALGRNADTIEALGKFGMRGGMYAPASRMGTHFISGRRKIPLPTVARGSVFQDSRAMDENGVFRFVFSDADDAVDYYNDMGASGDERVTNFARKYIDPRNGNFVPEKFHERDAAGNDFYAQPVYLVTMQDRFMAMSDSTSDLLAQRQELLDSGEYEGVSTPMMMAQLRGLSAGMPLQLQAMINNINQQSDLDARDKNLAIDMLTNHFIRTQQGNRITKRMLHRTGVHGFETGADEMFRAFHSNNEMMSRHRVAQTRIPAIAEANRKIGLFLDALRNGTPATITKLPLDQRDYVNRYYAKADRDLLHADKLAEDQREINSRIDGMMRPSNLTAEHFTNAVQSIATLNYLAKPVYFGMQAISLPMFTLPNMSAEMSRLDGMSGITNAWRYLQQGLADVGLGSSLWKGLTEATLEGKQLLQGFKKREGFMREGRVMRRARDFVAELKADLDTSGARHVDLKKEALDRMQARRAIGQAGLDQSNLRMDMQAPGLKNKAYRAIEQSTRIFRGLQEGIELVNRAAPVFGYINYYMDKGFDPEEAIELAINNTIKEQVGYSKANWPTWMSGQIAGSVFLFKKLAVQQAYSFYNSLAKVIDPAEPGDRKVAMIHLGTMTAVMWAIGGLVGNPLWEPMRYLMYLLGLSANWDDTKNAGEKLLAEMTTPMTAETLMYGLPRLAGIDLSSRAALDSLLFYQQPQEMSRDEWLKIVGGTAVGAIGTMGFDAVGNIYGLATGDAADKSWPKWLATMPVPGIIKDMLKTYDNVVNGPTTATGVSTGDPPGVVQAVVEAAGIRTRRQARPFEQGSAAKHKQEQKVQAEKGILVRRINASGGMTSGNMKLINEWNKAHPEKEMRINAKSIIQSRRRKREQEREIREQNVGAI